MKNRIRNRFLSGLLAIAMTLSLVITDTSFVNAASPVIQPESALETEDTLTVAGGDTITAGGAYTLTKGATGTITVNTTDPVTLTGAGGDSANAFTGLSIDCAAAGADVIIDNLAITSPVSGKNMFNFTGAGNKFTFKGVNLLECATQMAGKAMIHVGVGTELTIAGVEESSTLYFYKTEQAAGIGGDAGENNGAITINSGHIFGKGSKQGAVIGQGASTGTDSVAGMITINGGVLNLIAVARGALIGGSAGSNGGSAGGNVYVNGGSINLNVDFSGAAIGGGGYADGNDSGTGNLFVSGGSVRTYIDQNAVSSWSSYGVTAAGVNDAAITARKLDKTGNEVYLMTFDTSALRNSASSFDAKIDGTDYYNGGLHTYSYVNESLDKDKQTAIADTKSNWSASADKNLYFYATGTDHTVTVNGEKFTFVWNAETKTFNMLKPSVIALTTGGTASAAGGSVSVSSASPKAGDTITVTAAPADGYYLAQVRYADTRNITDAAAAKYTALTKNADGSYSFEMPDTDVTVYADFISKVWDGTVDLTWYDSAASSYHIQYAAQLAGAAALTNGLFNDYPLSGTNLVPNANEDGTPYGSTEELYNTYKTSSDATSSTTVVGNIHNLKALCSTGTTGANNQVTTNDYWYGGENFKGKTLYLDADINMGGTSDNGTWSGPNYTPIGGQYCLNNSSGYTKLSASFNGSFDGQGHTVFNIYCYRYTSNFGDSQSVGLIGRLGLHDSDPADLKADVSIRNVAVAGYIYSRRSVGGIVGKTGQSNSCLIENCVNFATVKNTDSKGVGGIAGAGWNAAVIKNCVNFGYIYSSYKNAGGISGSCEAKVYNCYDFGYVGASSSSQGQSFGTNNGGAVWNNCYWLNGSSVSNQAVYGSTSGSSITKIDTPEELTSNAFLTSLNGSGRSWVSGSNQTFVSSVFASCLKSVSSYGSGLSAYDCSGMPVPRAFIADAATVTSFSATGSCVSEYVAGQSFNPGTLVITARYSDDTTEAVTNYKVTTETGGETMTVNDTYLVLSGTVGGADYSFTYPVTVTDNALSSITITKAPKRTLYGLGETFDPDGMIVTATYTNGNSEAVTGYTFAPSGTLSATDSKITVSYSYYGITMTADVEISVMDSEKPVLNEEGYYEICSAKNLIWFAGIVNSGSNTKANARVMADIDLSGTDWTWIGNTDSVQYEGDFDGNSKTISFDGQVGLFRNIGRTGVVHGVVTSGKIENTVAVGAIASYSYGTIRDCVNSANVSATTTGYAGGIAANVIGGKIIDCVNKGAVNSLKSGSQYVGGITGYTRNATVTVDSVSTTVGCTISGCVNEGGITGYYNIGGIVGCEYGLDTVSECVNKGSVLSLASSMSMYSHGIGGVVGQGNSAGKVEQCVNTGNVTSEDYSVGGIIGYVANMSFVVSDCYNRASVSDTAVAAGCNVGGIVGRTQAANSTVRNCYNTGAVTAATTSTTNKYAASVIGYAAGVTNISNNYYLTGSAETGIGKSTDNSVVKESADLKTLASTLGSAYKDSNEYTNAGYPVLTWQPLNEAVVPEKLSVVTSPAKTLYNEGDTFDNTGMTIQADLSTGESSIVTEYAVTPSALTPDVKSVTITYTLNGVTVTTKQNVQVLSANAPKLSNDGAYMLETLADLNWFSEQILNGISNLNAELEADIDASGESWTPMGASSNPYEGTFNGNGHSITLSASAKQYVGLFACANGAVISDLTIKGDLTATYTSEDYIGAIAGYAVSTKITNCDNEAAVTFYGSYAAGITGYADGCEIRDCKNTGNVNAINSFAEAAAGIAGYTTNGSVVASCENMADISGGSKTGGIVGNAFGADTISQCRNTGTITGRYSIAGAYGTGGIAGNIGSSCSINECCNEGLITGASPNLGGILGYTANAAASVTNCYNSGDISGSGAATTSTAGGIIGKSNIAMTLQNCYNRGSVTLNNTSAYTAGSTGYIGSVAGYIGATTKESNNYYLEGTAGKGIAYPTSDNTISSNAATLKTFAASLGESYKDSNAYTNAGYPVLTWQTLFDTATLMTIKVTTAPKKTAYTENEKFDKDGMIVTASYSDGISKTVTGYSYTPSGKLLPDNNTIYISYTDNNVTKTTQQTITVSELGKNSSLSSLSCSPGKFDDAFSADNHVYTATVGNGALRTLVTATAADPNAAITIKKNSLTPETLTSGSAALELLDLGANMFTITVTAENGRDKTDYVVTITRQYSPVATLSALTLSEGTLSPEFDEGVKEYTASVSSDTNHIDLTATAKDKTISSMTVQKDGGEAQTIQNGEAAAIALETGENIYNITLTAQDGVSKETYTVKITRKAATKVSYQTHVENIGWQDMVSNGALSGTTGQSLRLEAVKIALEDQEYEGDIEYSAHVENIGWQDKVSDGELGGTTGRSLRVEAIKINLTGEMAEYYDVYYRVHAENYGWLNWAKNGDPAGTSGYSLRLEALEVVLVEKGQEAPVSDGGNAKAYVHPLVKYSTHVENIGWQGLVADGAMSGTSGQALRLEAIKIALNNPEYAGGIEYSTHVENIGWQNPVTDGAMSGTSGRSLRLEAITIKLTGEMADHYDIYYSVHAENIGWMGWASNGEKAGTAGMALRLEAIKIVLVEKGGDAPGSVLDAFRQAE